MNFPKKSPSVRRALALAGSIVPMLLATTAMAQDAAKEPAKLPGIRDDSIARLLPVPDPRGHRAALAARGLTYELNYVFDVIGNTSGGMRRGTVYSGRGEIAVEGNLEKLVGWQGARFRINAFQIHGGALTRDYIGNIAPVSNIEAFPYTRLFEAWVQQKLGIFTIRAGQLGADSETASSSTAGQFNNGAFGWPALNAGNIPSGGPAYPLATPGVSLKVDLWDQYKLPFEMLFYVLNGNPARAGLGDPQQRNRHGVDFRLRNGALYATEARYDFDKEGPMAGTYKIGAWYHSTKFDDKRWGTDGLSLADPSSNGAPLRHRGNHALYAIADQTLLPAGKGRDWQLSAFARGFFSPQSDRNLMSWQADGGFMVKGMFDRANDSFGVAASVMKIGSRARGFDRDFASFNPGTPVRGYEALIEANYLYEVRRGFTIQPSVQYIVHPGGKIANPRLLPDLKPIRNAMVFGVRTVIKY